METQLQPGIDEMLTALKQKGYQENIEYFWCKDKNARHFESDWGKRMPWVLIQFFKPKYDIFQVIFHPVNKRYSYCIYFVN